MAKRSLSTTAISATAFADTTNLTDNAYMGSLIGSSSTQRTNILEVYVGGQASSSSVCIPLLSRNSTIGATVGATTTFDAALDAATAALASPVTVGNAFTTKPQTSSTLHLLNLTFNAFGGIVRWVAAPGEEISIVGNTASLGAVSLALFTGSAAATIGSHIIYETL